MIHVAGTNGKGTTCQMLASIYQQAGYKTGLYTSPHLLDVRDRFRIDAKNIPDDDLLEFFQLHGDYVVEEKLTFFELTTGIAFWYFAEQDADIAVIETGLGGKLDATNVIDSEIAVITSIGMDHADILGDSIELIAAEKAGIIKPGKPVVIGILKDEALRVISKISSGQSSRILKAEQIKPKLEGGQFVLSDGAQKLEISAEGRKAIDRVNIAMSRLVVMALQQKFPVNDRQFVEGVEQMKDRFAHHAHFEKLKTDQNWYFDGAHNAEAVEILVEELKRIDHPDKWNIVLSFMKDKLSPEVAGQWMPFKKIYLFEQEGDRAAKLQQMKEFFPHAKTLHQNSIGDFLSSETLKRELVIFSGSFYFYNTVRHWMGTEAD